MRKLFYLLIAFMLLIQEATWARQNTLQGQLIETGTKIPLPGAMIILNPGNNTAVTDADGNFRFDLPAGEYELIARMFGYAELNTRVNLKDSEKTILEMIPLEMGLEEVEVLSTGYQQIPKSRASGSFVSLDEELVDRRISTNVIDRLEDVTSGLIFNRAGDERRDPISIRGRSTLGVNSQPLIVIDNFPYDGSLDDLNPNDVESITVLRDAAAASIWGARAGNGVIVVTTKSGRQNQPLKVSLTANANWIEHPDPFLNPVMAVDDFIDMEEQLFSSGFYNSSFTNPNKPPLTPVVETLYLEREMLITGEEAASRIDRFRSYDLREDMEKYLYRPQLNQQYSLGLYGGGKTHGYVISLGYDQQQLSEVGDSNSRLTFNLKNNFSLLKDKLGIQLGVYGVKTKSTDQNAGPYDLFFSTSQGMYPYARLADEAGNPLELTNRFSNSFKREAEAAGLLDWQYKPLEELGLSPTVGNQDDWRINLGMDYQVVKGISAKILYQYWQNQQSSERVYDVNSYYAREQINLFSGFDENGNLVRNIPLGGIIQSSDRFSSSHSLRGLLEFKHSWGEHWEFNGLAGAELKSLDYQSSYKRFYGFSPDKSTVQLVDYISLFPQYHNPRQTSRITSNEGVGSGADRFYSLFANGSLEYDKRLLLTFSVRRDASNLFGVDANQKAVPLWSTGLGWTLSEEGFYNWSQIPYVKLRLSYGYSGNVDRSLSAYTTARVGTLNTLTQLPFATILNPPNRNLRWEKVSTTNLGLDMETRNGRISGTLEFYIKEGIDLIGQSPYAPSSGITLFTGNNSSTRTKGFDLQLETKNLTGEFQWNTVLLFSGLREEVTHFEIEPPVSSILDRGAIGGAGGATYPVEGRPLFSVYSYPWAGLNPDTGAPKGILDGEVSEDYAAIVNGASLESLRYHGPARPSTFGSFRNTFAFKGFSLSANISYRFGYYFRRSSVQYVPILMGRGGHADFGKRWQNPGDELITEVPSIPSFRDSFRDTFYRSSEVLVEKGDHIRLQDIRLGYRVPTGGSGFFSKIGRAELFLYANNLGMIWKATDTDWDPDYGWNLPRRSLAIGIQMDF
ncbi:SusC/RagA family TonB-linked outer membrane protein [Algoriphagus aestuarii]|nr:SusC/RagA family TonB-linked outer membrane protein [Algoriphagus aestuarii]